MGKSLYINRIAINPPKGKTDVTFRTGLNIIRAVLYEEINVVNEANVHQGNLPGTRNSVGKTTFVNLLDYGLGKGKFLGKDKVYGRKKLELHDLLMEFRIGKQEYTVQRNLVKGEVCLLYNGWVIDDLLVGVEHSFESYQDADYRNFLDQSIFQGANTFEDKKIVSFRDVMQIIFRDQVGGFEFIDKPGNYTASADSKRKLMQFLSGLTTYETLSANSKVIEAEEVEKEAKKALDIIKRYVNHKVNQAEQVIRSEADDVLEKMKEKQRVIDELKMEIMHLQKHSDERIEKKNKFLQKKMVYLKEVQLLNTRLNSFQATLNEIQIEKENIETANQAHLFLQSFEYEICPVCLVPITNDPSFVCPKKSNDENYSEEVMKTMQNILSNEKQDLILAINDLNKSINEIHSEVSQLDSKISDVNLEISKDVNKILELMKNEEQELQVLSEKFTGLKQDLDYFRDRDEYQRKHGRAKDNLTIAKTERDRIQKLMDEGLESLKTFFHEAVSFLYFNKRIGSLSLSERAKNFIAEIKYLTISEGKDTGAAAITLAVIAFDLALLKLGINQNTPHPRLLVHDSPNINDIEPLVYNRIFSYVIDMLEKPFIDKGKDPDFQYIITTILMPEELNQHPYIRLELSNNGDDGKLFEFTF
ncbi:hypothetical protein [Paenibacillus medicaginis]|uniref:DUF2326 domain-containing protein n=1 Tax=Paenibacillus medicaginis TaxID=1470560 RepID=A0ABV5BV48_9BACL